MIMPSTWHMGGAAMLAAYPFLSALGIVEALQGYKVVTKGQLLIPTFVKIDPCLRDYRLFPWSCEG
jgi:hypothetical protein